MDNFIKDITYGLRLLTRNPGVTLVAILTLGFGIGANTAIFSGVSAFLMRSLPVPRAHELIRPVEIAEERSMSDEMSYPDFLDYRNQSTASFTGLAAEDMVGVALTEDLRRAPKLLEDRGSHWMNVIGRLKPGVTMEQASAELSGISDRINKAYPDDRPKDTTVRVLTEIDGRWADMRNVFKSSGAIAMAIVGLILLIACANVANLMLARAAARRKEIGIRDFDERDRQDSPRVAIVNQRMAQLLWPGESAVGKRFFIGTESRDGWEVVGVVKTGKYRGLAEDPRPFFYYALDQRRARSMALVLSGSVDPRSLVSAVRGEIQALNRNVPASGVKTMTEHMTYALWAPNMAATFSLAFGVLALLLSAVGLYSVMAYVVSQRTREVGIRMALGANRSHVMKMITKQGMWLAGVGVAIGLLLALALVQVLSSLLIGVSGYDPLIFILVPLLLAVVALIACYLPARRATKVDPLKALRYE